MEFPSRLPSQTSLQPNY
uniref:Uncharacterized protein n=1 Tax=Arundo donax TaxID=35708 RepID=A0A0A9FWM9_ARUDO